MPSCCTILLGIILCCYAIEAKPVHTAKLIVNASHASGRKIPETFMGVFFEEINHAGAGGLWAELVSNRGFESGGQTVPSNIYPWSVIGDESSILVSTDHTSCFERNKIALRMEVLSNSPYGVGISNPGYWGMNIEQGKKYKVVFYVRSIGLIGLKVSLVGSDDGVKLASTDIKLSVGVNGSMWEKVETVLEAKGTNHDSSLQITTTNKGVLWLDQVSAMPLDTYKGHGFRKDLFQMVAELKPRFLRFPGGCFVQGLYSRNAFRWKDTIGPWEHRPGHFGDNWGYWTDDGLGYFEGLQLAEDLNALPVWVFNSGNSVAEEVNTSAISPFVQEALDGIEFARGASTSTWGSIRAAMGHPEPFDLRYVAVGNEDCAKFNYQGNYLKFYDAIRRAYPDIKIISNCNATKKPLNHPADLYDYHNYSYTANVMSNNAREFDHAPRIGPKAFVSEYAVSGKKAGKGNLWAAVGEAGFLIGLEKNSDLVKMVSYAPLFVNTNDRSWNPDAIVFDSHQSYGTPSYWVLKLFRESSGATFLNSTLKSTSTRLAASAISWKSSQDNKFYLRIKVANLASNEVNLKISIKGLESSVNLSQSTKTVLTSSHAMDENSFSEPKKVVPHESTLQNAGEKMNVKILPYSVALFDMLM
ncbi:alpha-L-arabinofuranosidase 1-like [Gastrolobium bilobum]|uniref:alpha-L-arabinofuranosidase 1-like n=1 Tax=Gastrolobium bilobum TaxID=150636 RepID=UPI002AB25575|nr:alpha-L-arabinofuranosidase 1-like [Gastrolobium bilobum]